MAKISRQVGTISQIFSVFVLDTTSTTGAGKTGLTNSNFTAYYKINTGSASVAITLDASSGVTLGTYEPSNAAHGAIKEIDATNMPGLYEFQVPNNGLASGDEVVFMLTGSGIRVAPIEIELTAVNNQSAAFGLSLAKTTNITGFNDIAATAIVSSGAITTSGGAVSTVTTVTNQLTAAAIATGIWKDTTAGDFTVASSIGLSLYTGNHAPGAASGLALVGSNMGTTSSLTGDAYAQLNTLIAHAFTYDGNNLPKVDLVDIAGAAVATGTAQLGVNVVNIGAHVVVLDANNYPGVNIVDIAGTASAGTAGYVGPDWAAIHAPTTAVDLSGTTIKNVDNAIAAVTTVTNLTNAPTAGDFTAAMKASLSAATPASVTGAVGSVTGAVGSVTGNVGGNVAGSVGSVTAPVTAGTVSDKTGYALSSAGLDQISLADPGATASITTFPKALVWLFRRFFKKATMTSSQVKTYADDGVTVNVTQAVSDDGTTQTQGPAS